MGSVVFITVILISDTPITSLSTVILESFPVLSNGKRIGVL